MLPERIKIINDISSGSSTRLRESFFRKHFTETYSMILEFCLNINDLPFIQKLWHWVNNIEYYILCECGSPVSFNRNWLDGYRKACSAKCAQKNESVKEKRAATSLIKYGVDNPSKSESVKNKMFDTNIKKWGFKSTFQNKEVRDKWKENVIEKYGVGHIFQTDGFKIKTKQHYLKKYGVEHQLNVEEVKQRIKDTCMKKYGVSTYLNTEHSRSSIKKFNRSSYEDEICLWLDSMGVEYINSDRNILKPNLVDIYIPVCNLAIEFNGIWWHSEIYKDKLYHYNKTIGCEKMGIHLIHIWEDDWKNRKDILKSIIKNKIGIFSNRIYARKCIIRELNNKETSDFLNDNHVQGYSKYNKSIGLFFNDELVSLMTFGWRYINGTKQFELLRFCNKINTCISGSASKLFKYYLNNFPCESIISFADRSIFTGNLYKKLGFKFIHHTGVNYWWVVGGIRYHRFTYNKKKLVKNGFDPLKTEVEIMHEIGNYRVFGCGQDKWVWSK